MAVQAPINFQKWIEEHRHLLKPPVGNQVVYEDTEFIVMVVGGPNSRKDFHYNEGEEFFYQIEGDIVVRIEENGAIRDVPIKEGEIFLLPARVPHSPNRGEGSIGLVIERRRREDERDGLMWFCENCNTKLYEEYFRLENIITQFQGVFERFYANENARTCSNCGTVMEAPSTIS